MIYKLLLFLFLSISCAVSANPMNFTLSDIEDLEKLKDREIVIYLNKDKPLFNNGDYNRKNGLYYKWIEDLENLTNLKFKVIEKNQMDFEKGIKEGIPDLIFGVREKENYKEYIYLEKPLTLPIAILSDQNTPTLTSESELIDRDVVFIERNVLINKDNSTNRNFSENSFPYSIATTEVLSGSYEFYLKDLEESLVLLQNNPTLNLKINSLSKKFQTEYYFGVRKELQVIYTLLDNILTENHFDKEFIHSSLINYIKDIQLSSDDVKDYYHGKKKLKVYIPQNDDLFPLYFEDRNSNKKGMLIDYFSEIEDILNVEIEFVKGKLEECDINPFVLLVNGSVSGSQEFYLTTPYYEFQYLIFNNKNAGYIFSINGLEKRKIAVVKGSITETYLNKKGYKDNLVYYDSQVEVLEAVDNGSADVFLGGVKGIDILINKHNFNNIKVGGIVQDKVSIAFGVLTGDFVLHKTLSFLEKSFFFALHKKNRNYIENQVEIVRQYRVSILTFIISLTVIILFLIHIKRIAYINKRLSELNIGLIRTLEIANSFNDEDTGSHIKRVGKYCEIIGKNLKIPRKLSTKIVLYSSLHDIGKIGISDLILNKSSKLTKDEFEEIKKHPEIGYEMLKDLNIDEVALNIIRYHHEKWDGSGYNLGLKKEEIPLEARIVTIADVYDALRQKRVYKEAYSHEKALEIIKAESGKHFDPDLVKVFIKQQALIKKAYDGNPNNVSE